MARCIGCRDEEKYLEIGFENNRGFCRKCFEEIFDGIYREMRRRARSSR